MKNPKIVDGEPAFNHQCDDCKPQHTPTPWKLHKCPDEYSITGKINGQDAVIANVVPMDWHETAANAKFVIRAVNTYERDQEIKMELLVALATMIDGYRTLASTVEEKEVWLTNPGVIRATKVYQAIVKAEGR